MKRSQPLRRSGFISRGKPLTRSGRVKPRNRKRSAKAFARNYGDEAAAVRAMPCLAASSRRCVGPIHVAHVTARGRGGCKGGRFDAVPLCAAHHGEAGEAGTSWREVFERRHGLNLRAEADRIALEHVAPLGLRTLVRRWDLEQLAGAHYQGQARLVNLDAYERAALFGWVRRRMEREGQASQEVLLCSVSDDLHLHVADGCALIDAVGWPS